MTNVVTAAYGYRILGLGSTPWLALSGADELPELTYSPLSDRWPTDRAWAIHPGLTATLIPRVVATAGDVMLHAGSVALGGLAWVVVGPRAAGKSTMMLALHRNGHDVLCDDTVIVRDGHVFAGPRCIDLRHPAAGSVPVRNRRHRVTLAPVAWRQPLGGFIHLRWREEPGPPTVSWLTGGDRLRALVDEDRGDAVSSQAVGMLELAGWPAYALHRHRSGAVDDVADLISGGAIRGRPTE